MKLTLAERIGNLFSFGAVAKYKLEAMQRNTECNIWSRQNEELLKRNDELIKQCDQYSLNACLRSQALRDIASMGTPNMAHIGKKMQSRALEGLGQQNPE